MTRNSAKEVGSSDGNKKKGGGGGGGGGGSKKVVISQDKQRIEVQSDDLDLGSNNAVHQEIQTPLSPAPSSPSSPTSSSSSSTTTSAANKPTTKKPHNGLLEHKVFHAENAPSLLSTETTSQNYRGFINLAMLVLFVSQFRLIVENYKKYGILIDITSQYIDWPTTLLLFLTFNIFIIVALAIEWRIQHKDISERQSTIFHVINTSGVLAVPVTLIVATNALPATGLIVLMAAIVLWMKLISYAYSNSEYRVSISKGKPYYEVVKNNDVVLKYPFNLTFRNMYYFVFAPTLVYQLNYPRSPKIRPFWLAKRILELIFYSSLAVFLMEQYMFPTVRNALEPLQKFHLFALLERLLKLSVPNLYIWLIGFYLLFHLWLNILAEILRFGDRHFYGAWWNCTTMDEYWRIWNIPTHNWLIKHIHIPLVKAGVSKIIASICVFTVSAVFHELLVSVPVHTFRAWAFIGMMANIPLIIFTRALFSGSQIGNVIFWLSFCFFGQPLGLLLYYNDYMTQGSSF
eukprot:TRINITY_DN2235_c0_g1_i2.p1 TRINITY_DN2235_c0_g1~~TRINITY_DN2235_c0_g1_i2.p1  ORF type:complete len:515 (+),score=110.94 TRINITY_DN2235_c0_g1_i2:223-1767(+)